MQFNLDLGALAQAIVNALVTTLTNLVSPLPNNFAGWVSDQISSIWDGIWNSGANLLVTPFELTLNYPPAQLLGQQLALLVYGLTALAVVLLGLRHLWRSFTGGTNALNDVFSGVLMGVLLAGGSTIIVGQAYVLTAAASNAIGRFNFTPAFSPHDLASIGPAFVVSVFTLTVMMVYGWKLMMRAAYRIVLLMFLTPFAPIAGIFYGIPQTRWIAVSYYITLGGWLAGGFLAIGAISLGLQISTGETGILALIFGVALVQLAYDLMVILPRWAFGNMGNPGLSIPNVLAAAAGAAVGGGVGGAVGGFAGGAAGSASVVGALGTRAASGALMSPALMSPALGLGYD